MQNAGLQYVEGVTPIPESPFGVTQMQNNGTSSSTSSLRQFRKKDNVDKTSGAVGGHSAPNSRADSLNSSHVARVAPHNHYPHKQNEYFRYPPQYQEYSSPYKDHTVKYSEIAEPVPQAIPHLEHLPPSVLSKHKEKDYAEMCNIPQQPHLNKPYSEHQYNGQQNYPTEMALHHQYMQKEPQTQMHSPYKPESQYIPKEGAFNHQISPFLKYNIPTQSRNYGHLENSSLGSFQRMDSHIARSLMSEHPHIRDFPGDYGGMEQSRMYAQKQRYYPAPLPPTNPTYPPNYPHRNIPTQQYNYPNCNYPRTAQVNSSMGRYPINMERSMSPRRTYPENLDMGMNFSSVQQKISSTYPNYPAYAQHYQHRRPSAVPQDYYHHQQHPQARPHPQYMPTHHPQEVAENHVASNNIRQYLENWAEEEPTTEISPQIDNPKYIPRINRDEANEVYVINASELPQYLENGVPLVTSENGQYIFKSNVSIDNTGAIKILEKSGENAVLPTEAQERVVSLHIIENPKTDCLINTRTSNINQEHSGSANQVPAATINVITTNTNHSNQEHAVQHSYNVTTPAFNANRMHVMHQIPPINQNGPQHNQNFENSVNLCLHPNMPSENNGTSQQPITPNAATLENTIRLSPHIQPVEKSPELHQRDQNNPIVDGSSSEKNRLKIQVLSYQEVPQNSCIVMPSTQSRLNFDESLLPNQVPSDAKGAKNEFEVRNVDGDEESTISHVITSNDNILNEVHEELDKIVEDTLTSSNINIPMVSCERDHLPKIQEKCDTTNTSVNSRIPDDLNLDLESNPKDLSNSISDYTMESSCNQQNEGIMDLSTSRRGSKNDNDEQAIQSVTLDTSSSNVHNKLEQVDQEAHNDVPILSEYSTSSNEDVTSISNSDKREEITSPKASVKHMPLIEDNLEARSTPSHSSLVLQDIVIDPKQSSDTDKPVDQEENNGSNEENVSQGKDEIEEIGLPVPTEIPLVQSDICDASTVDDFPHSERRSSEISNALDTALEAKLSEIVGEPYRPSEKDSFSEETAKEQRVEKEINKEDDNSAEIGDHEENRKEETKTQPEEILAASSVELPKTSKDEDVEEREDISYGNPATLVENIKEKLSLKISDDSSVKKKKEGCRKRRIFSVDDIIYRIGPNIVQNRRDSIPDNDCTPDIFLEEVKAEGNPQQMSNQASDSDPIGDEKIDESGISSVHAKEESGNGASSCEITYDLQESNTVAKSPECNPNSHNKFTEKPLSPATSTDPQQPCKDHNIPKGSTVENMLTEEQTPNNIEAIVLMENMKPSGFEKICLNTDMPVENVFEEECDKSNPSPKEIREADTIQSVVSLPSEIKSYLLASEDIISVDRTLEFISSIEAKSPENEVVEETVREKCDISVEELPLVENRYSEEFDVIENQEPSGNVLKTTFTEMEIIRSPETIKNQNDDSDMSALPTSEPSDDRIEVGVVQMDCSEGGNAVENQGEGSEIVTSKLSDVRMEDESQKLCSKSEDSVENREGNTKKESENVTFDAHAMPDVSMDDQIQNCSKTEDSIEKISQAGNFLPRCRFSVIHKIEDSKRIIPQENIRTEENYEACISKIHVDSKTLIQTTNETKFPEGKTDQLKVYPNETSENPKAVTPNHCSVIQSIEGMQDEIIEKEMEIVERIDEEKSSEKIEGYKETIDVPNQNTPCNEIPPREPSAETLKTSEKIKCSSILAKKDELTFEQKFVEPLCSKSEENIQKIEEIEEKSPEEVQYRSVLKIEENNVLLEIAGELVEITVNQVNGKNVITVIPMSNTATVDFNDNYEPVDRAQLCEDAAVPEDLHEPEMKGVLQETREESKKEVEMKEEPESTQITTVSEEVNTTNRSEYISSTQSESIGDIFEDIILNDNEIIIGDESLEEEINLDLQSKDVLEVEEPREKPALFTKAAKKLYDDIAFHIPTKTYSSLREFRRIKSKPESSTNDFDEEPNQSKAKRSSKRSIRVSTRKRSVSEQNEGSQTALRELIERRKMRKEKIRLKYTQYAKQESRILIESVKADSLNIEQDDKKVADVTKMERLPMNSMVKKSKPDDELKRREFKKKMHIYKEKIKKKPVGKKNEVAEQNDSVFPNEKIIISDLEIAKNKSEEKPTSTSVIVSSSISTVETSQKNFHEAGTTTAKEISKNPSSQDKTPKFLKISTPRDLSLTKNVNEHYLSRKDHSNLKKKLSIQEYNSRKRKSSDCMSSVPEKSVKLINELGNASAGGGAGGVAKPSTIYSDKQLECLPNSVKDPRRRLHCANMQPARLQRTLSENLHKFQTQSISSSRPHKLSESPQLMKSVKLKDPLLKSNQSNTREVQNYKNYKTLLLGKSSVDKYVPKPTKISTRRKTIEVMNDRRLETTEITKKKVSFDDNVQINEINTTQTKIASVKPETTSYCEVSSSCSDILEDKISEDGMDHINENNLEEPIKGVVENIKIKSDHKRKNDWEDSNSPKNSITDVFAASFLDKTRIDNLKTKNKGKCIIDISDFDTSLINNELKSPYGCCFNSNTTTYEDAGSLKDYKDEVDSKLNSLNIQIPKNTKTRIINEDDVLIHKFLRKEQLNSDEIKQIRRIIYLKKKIQQITHQNSNAKNENESYEVKKNFEQTSHKDLKLQLKKIDGRPRKKKKRFRNLYSDSPESSEGEVQGTAGEFSVYEGENMSGVKLIFRRKTDLMHLQPVVKLQRCKYIESMAKKLKIE